MKPAGILLSIAALCAGLVYLAGCSTPIPPEIRPGVSDWPDWGKNPSNRAIAADMKAAGVRQYADARGNVTERDGGKTGVREIMNGADLVVEWWTTYQNPYNHACSFRAVKTVMDGNTNLIHSGFADFTLSANESRRIEGTLTIPGGKGHWLQAGSTAVNSIDPPLEYKLEVKYTVETPIKKGEILQMPVTRSLRMKVTGYCPCRKCTPGKGVTATGTSAAFLPGCAADWSVCPPGTVVDVEGYGTAIVDDSGSRVRGNHIDLRFRTHSEAKAWGCQYLTVRIADKPEGKR